MAPLPDQPLRGPFVWTGDELFDASNAPIELTRDERTELVEEDPETSAGRRGRELAERLETGRGALWIRGFPLEGAGDEATARRFASWASTVGTLLPQTATGATVLRVEDERREPGDPRIRGPHTNRALGFHTDRCDVIAFLCVRSAQSGGTSEILSSAALLNAMREEHPEHLDALGGTFPYLRHTVDPGNAQRVTQVPLFTMYAERFAASYLRVLIDRAAAEQDLPDLSPEQRNALDALDALAERPSLRARVRLEPGDVLLLNNWVTFHRRTAFVDPEPPALPRLLLRTWLSSPVSRAVDPRFADHFGATAAGSLRGGMHLEPPRREPR